MQKLNVQVKDWNVDQLEESGLEQFAAFAGLVWPAEGVPYRAVARCASINYTNCRRNKFRKFAAPAARWYGQKLSLLGDCAETETVHK